jgi:dinuclear metal center YbgI/SA1388 family protein
MRVRDIVEVMDAIAPPRYAESWDSVGLLVGARDAEVERALLTIDLTEAVLAEAIAGGVGLVVAYHPPIFQPLPALTDADPKQRIVLEAAAAGVAIYSPHTALDAAPGGVNDWLAEGVGRGDVRALTSHASVPAGEARKIVTFCPADAADTLRGALASAGAGRIGDYEVCSFEMEGTGTFHGGPDTSPAVGRRGALERVPEVRLEMVCPAAALGLAVATLRQAHPYEEPPIEIYELQQRPIRHIGAGRRIVLDQKVPLTELVTRLKSRLGVKQLRVATPSSPPRRYATIGLCAGAGGSLLAPALAQGCELFLTGEMRHHDVLAAQAAGCTIVLAGHTNTERGYLKTLRSAMTRDLPQVTVTISRHDRDPLRAV